MNGIIVLLNSQPLVLLNFKNRPESDVNSGCQKFYFMLSDICRIHFHIRSNAGTCILAGNRRGAGYEAIHNKPTWL